jgi:OFA family oxalate/formate antiporter-like MFS transporter
MTYRITNKWIVVIGAISVQLAIGAMYAWSLFNNPISEAFGWDLLEVVLTYSIALATFSLTTILSGRLQLKIGPRYTALIGGVLYSSGILLSSLATSPFMLYITYGVMAGAGVGFVYVNPLATLVKWFPNNKGTVTGVATAAFAFGAVIFKEVIFRLLDVEVYTPEVISSTFLTLGIVYTVLTIGGALLLDVPKDFIPVTKKVQFEAKSLKTREMLKTSNFYKLLFSDLLALMPGLLVIGMAKDIGIDPDFLGIDKVLAATVVTIIALFNGAGRLTSGALADKLGALNIYRVMYLVTIISLAVLAFVPMSFPVFLIAVIGIGVGYGSFLSLVPTIVGQLFGGKYFSANYALIFQAYGVAALLGPAIRGSVATFNQTFMIAMATAIAGLMVAMFIKKPIEDLTDKEA